MTWWEELLSQPENIRSEEVQFIGGELDGQRHRLPELLPTYRAACFPRRNPWMNPTLDLSTISPQTTEYVLTKKGDQWFYVERELMALAEAQRVDPRP